MSVTRYLDDKGFFQIDYPDPWVAEEDGEGGVLIFREEGNGLLHLMPFERPTDEDADPAEELYAFLADQDIELEEDEVEDVELAGTGLMALCEYLAEEVEEDVFWLVGVATGPGRLLFVSYSCPSGEENAEREAVRDILDTIRFRVLDT